MTDKVIAMMIADAEKGASTTAVPATADLIASSERRTKAARREARWRFRRGS